MHPFQEELADPELSDFNLIRSCNGSDIFKNNLLDYYTTLVSSEIDRPGALCDTAFEPYRPLGDEEVFKGCVGGRKTTLETSGEDVKLHSKRVEKMYNYTRNECVFRVQYVHNQMVANNL